MFILLLIVLIFLLIMFILLLIVLIFLLIMPILLQVQFLLKPLDLLADVLNGLHAPRIRGIEILVRYDLEDPCHEEQGTCIEEIPPSLLDPPFHVGSPVFPDIRGFLPLPGRTGHRVHHVLGFLVELHGNHPDEIGGLGHEN